MEMRKITFLVDPMEDVHVEMTGLAQAVSVQPTTLLPFSCAIGLHRFYP